MTVSFDGRYVWSFQPARDATRDGARLTIGWPAALRPHLHGRTRLTVADHHDGRVYVDQVVVLGGQEPAEAGQLRVEDAHGHPLAVNKVGNLTRVFAETDDGARREILEGTARVLDDLRGAGGVDAYLNYGCLLGAVREGRMIGTDCDADLCYLSAATTPVDVIARVLPARAGDAGPRLAHRADVRRRLQGAAAARRRPHLLRRRVRGVLPRRHLLPARQPQRAAAPGGGAAHLDDRARGRRAARPGRPRGDAVLRLRADLAGAGPGVPLHRPARGRPPPRRLAPRASATRCPAWNQLYRTRGGSVPTRGVRVRPLGAAPDRGPPTRSRTSVAGSAGTPRSSPGGAPGAGLRRLPGRPHGDRPKRLRGPAPGPSYAG